MDALVVGCGLSGAVVARFLAEELGKKVVVWERRDHIGGNMYDYKETSGILVHKYGPHTFHTTKKELFEYMQRFCEWSEYHLTCGAEINGKYTPTPFNFQTIDDFFPPEKAQAIKDEIRSAYGDQTQATILELLESPHPLIHEYAKFLFDNDYSLYTAKQWGISPTEIDVSVLKRVPVEFSYQEGYFTDPYQYMPQSSYVDFFNSLLDHRNIEVVLNKDAMDYLSVDLENQCLLYDGNRFDKTVIYTGAVDELLDCRYGSLPYRSLRFEWKTLDMESYQDAPVVAYPQAPDYTRITEYKKLPIQDVGEKTTIAVEYSVPYHAGEKVEPYYPIPNAENQKLYEKYADALMGIPNLYLCGRLAQYKYYNMDQALENALALCRELSNNE